MSNAKNPARASNSVNSDTAKFQQRLERRRNRGNGATADWGSVDPGILLALVSAATADGTLITFGYTRDGGAYMVGLFNDGERATEYCRPTENVDEFLQLLADDLRG